MKITIGGIRGTAPVTNRAYGKYGGDTTCILVEGSHKSRVMIDMGTGTRLVDHRLRPILGSEPLLILMTHYHLDHLMGIPSFSPLYDTGCNLQFVGPRLEGYSVEEVMHRLLAKPFWPLQMDTMRATVRFDDLDAVGYNQGFMNGALKIRWTRVHHPGGCVAYRIEDTATHTSLVFATDIEWPDSTPEEKTAFLRLCREPRPVDLLLFDGQFTAETAPKYRSWGHSTWKDGVAVARETGAHKLTVIHHSPYRDDTDLDRTEAELNAEMPEAHLAIQGQTLELGTMPL